MKRFPLTLAAAGIALAASSVHAQECQTDMDAWDLDDAQVMALYDCIKDQMAEAYGKSDNPVASEFRSWNATATRPAVAGPHGERFLQTFANDIAAEEYLKFAEEGVEMPVGSVLAKESFSLHTKGDKKGQPRVGPLFIMTKVAPGEADETDGWVYAGVQPNGKELKFKQSFCHDCHAAFEGQDALGYPLEEVRIAN